MNEFHAQVMHHTGDTAQKCDQRLRELLKFFHVAAETDDVVVPSRWVDQAWHALLEDPQLYDRFLTTNRLPLLTHSKRTVTAHQYLTTREKLRSKFGELDTTAWPPLPRDQNSLDPALVSHADRWSAGGFTVFADCGHGGGGGAGDHP